MAHKTFVSYAKQSYGVAISEEQAKTLREVWKETWEEMKEYLKGTPDPDHPGFYIGHTITGRRKPNSIYTASLNYAFQGLASDCSKNALWKLWLEDAPTVNFVHGSLWTLKKVNCGDPKFAFTCKYGNHAADTSDAETRRWWKVRRSSLTGVELKRAEALLSWERDR